MIMVAVRHRLPENRAGRLTATLAVLTTLACAVVVLAAFRSQGRPGATPWVAAPPAGAAPPAAIPASSAAPAPSVSASTGSPAASGAGAAESAATRRPRSPAVQRKTAKARPTPTWTTGSRHGTAKNPTSELIGLIGRLLGRGGFGRGFESGGR
jgi:hypothetical protein